MELDLFCQLFYASHYIPMALLHKGEIQKKLCQHRAALTPLWENS